MTQKNPKSSQVSDNRRQRRFSFFVTTGMNIWKILIQMFLNVELSPGDQLCLLVTVTKQSGPHFNSSRTLPFVVNQSATKT